MSFHVDLWDGFDVVSKHLEGGITSCHEVAKFFKKLAEIEDAYSQALMKLCKGSGVQTFSQKLRNKSTAGMSRGFGSLREAWNALLLETERVASIHGVIGERIAGQVSGPLHEWAKEKEAYRKGLVEDGLKLQSMLVRSRKDSSSSGGGGGGGAGGTGAVPADIQVTYYTELMPRILHEFNILEEERFERTGKSFRAYVDTYRPLPDRLRSFVEGVDSAIRSVESQRDIQEFIREQVTGQPPPYPISFRPDGQAVGGVLDSPRLPDLPRGRSFARKFKSTNRGSQAPPATAAEVRKAHHISVFGKGLHELTPGTNGVPRILQFLIDAILENEGAQAEGIFRVPADMGKVKSSRRRLDEGYFEMDLSDVHLPASLLKMWLRELPEPLIPFGFYDDAIANAGNVSICQQLISERIPDVNRAVVFHLVSFLQILNRPDNVKRTRMTADNLALVFGPVFLRDPRAGTYNLLGGENMGKQFQFVKTLILHLEGNPSARHG